MINEIPTSKWNCSFCMYFTMLDGEPYCKYSDEELDGVVTDDCVVVQSIKQYGIKLL